MQTPTATTLYQQAANRQIVGIFLFRLSRLSEPEVQLPQAGV